ncbi:MAG: transporter substrate-binding protein, partial [Rubritepida sp.]|nr:transporter substrate-binding protein [Rubritepida sp.]
LAQSYSDRPVRLIVPFGAGGITDFTARAVADAAAPHLGRAIIIENRTGAGGGIAGGFVARAAPDGDTLMLATLGMLAVNPLLFRSLAYDPGKDFTPVSLSASSPSVLVVRPGADAPPDLAAYLARARAKPGELSWGTAGVGSSPHQLELLLESLAGISLMPVHFRSGAEAVQGVLAGQLLATAEAVPQVGEHIRAGTLKGLCVTAAERLSVLPEVPTAAEAGLPGWEHGSISGIVGPANLPTAVLARLSAAFGKAMESPALRRALGDQGVVALDGTAASMRRIIESETVRWRRLLSGVTPT